MQVMHLNQTTLENYLLQWNIPYTVGRILWDTFVHCILMDGEVRHAVLLCFRRKTTSYIRFVSCPYTLQGYLPWENEGRCPCFQGKICKENCPK